MVAFFSPVFIGKNFIKLLFWPRKYLFWALFAGFSSLLLSTFPPSHHLPHFSFMNPSSPEQSDVVIVGGGLAGLAATIEAYRVSKAHKTPLKIHLIEGEKNLGGNSAKATSGINGCETYAQKLANISDSRFTFEKDVISSGSGISAQNLVQILVAKSSDAIHWLHTNFQLDLTDINQLGGHSVARTHREAPAENGAVAPIGWNIIKKLSAYVNQAAKEEGSGLLVLTSCEVTEILWAGFEGAHNADVSAQTSIRGVVYVDSKGEKHTILSNSVVLTTGGYGCDHSTESLLQRFAPNTANLPTTNGAFAQGRGVKMAEKLGAALIHMDKVQVHPTGFVNPADPKATTKFLAPETLRGCGGILINHKGERFCNELGRRDYVTQKIFENCAVDPETNHTFAYLVLNQQAVQKFGKATFDFYLAKGFFQSFPNYLSIHSKFPQMNSEILKNTLSQYQTSCQQGSDPFQKVSFPVSFSPEDPLFVGIITPSIHYTMGGVEINGSGQVVSATSKKPIGGLFAAGEVSGGLHGENRLAGNSLLECVVFGRIAGERATHLRLFSEKKPFDSTTFQPLRFRERIDLTEFMRIFRFDLPSPLHETGLGLGEYISVAMNLGQPDECIRFYSPISRPNEQGLIDLLVKVDAVGVMSHHLNSLTPGDFLHFKGPIGGPKLSFSSYKKIGMIAGGAGISPMIQIIRSFFQSNPTNSSLQLSLMYGSINENEILFKQSLDEDARRNKNFKVFYTLNEPSPGWKGAVGFIDADKIKQFMHPPQKDTLVLVCGPPAMCKTMKTTLESLGYTKDMYYSFM